MSAPRPSFRPRPMGGFNTGMGGRNEHMDENAMQAAVQQKALGQQQTNSAQSTTGGSALGAHDATGLEQIMGGGGGGQNPKQPPKPRSIGTLTEELITRPAQDVAKEIGAFFDLHALLGINPDKDDPQKQARKKQMLQRWNQLNEEQQALAKQKYQKEMQKKQHEEQEKQMQKQQKEQKQANQLEVPSGPKKGAVGPGGSKKQKATNKLQHDRKTLSGPKGSN